MIHILKDTGKFAWVKCGHPGGCDGVEAVTDVVYRIASFTAYHQTGGDRGKLESITIQVWECALASRFDLVQYCQSWISQPASHARSAGFRHPNAYQRMVNAPFDFVGGCGRLVISLPLFALSSCYLYSFWKDGSSDICSVNQRWGRIGRGVRDAQIQDNDPSNANNCEVR